MVRAAAAIATFWGVGAMAEAASRAQAERIVITQVGARTTKTDTQQGGRIARVAGSAEAVADRPKTGEGAPHVANGGLPD